MSKENLFKRDKIHHFVLNIKMMKNNKFVVIEPPWIDLWICIEL